GREIEEAVGGIDGAGERAVARVHILIELLVVGRDGAVPDRQAVIEIMLDDGHAGLYGGDGLIEARAAEEGGEIAVRRKRRRRIEAARAADHLLRGIAAIGGAVVVEIF